MSYTTNETPEELSSLDKHEVTMRSVTKAKGSIYPQEAESLFSLIDDLRARLAVALTDSERAKAETERWIAQAQRFSESEAASSIGKIMEEAQKHEPDFSYLRFSGLVNDVRVHLRSLHAQVEKLERDQNLNDSEFAATQSRLAVADAALAEARDGQQYSDTRLTEHAEAVGVDPDHIDFIDETTKAIIQMWADNSKLKATNAEQFRLYCEETKKHNETSAKLATLTSENAALREALTTIADGIDEDDSGLTLRTVQKYAQAALHPATKEGKA